LLYFSLAGAPLTVRALGSVAADVDDELRLALRPGHMHFFDPADGRAVEA